MKGDKIFYIALITFGIIVCAIGYSNYLEKNTDDNRFKSDKKIYDEDTAESKENEEKNEGSVVVYIVGEVNEPDIYTVPAGSRIADVIKIAGGATENADLERINLAKTVKDEDKINVPGYGEEEDENTESGTEAEIGTVNINTATREELKRLPYVGDVLADKIIYYRKAHGGFRRKEDLKKVQRIGDKLYNEIEEYICVD